MVTLKNLLGDHEKSGETISDEEIENIKRMKSEIKKMLVQLEQLK
jgi:hypothetical protein